jgi:hypothetical protein
MVLFRGRLQAMPYALGIVAGLVYLGADDVTWTPSVLVAAAVLIALLLAGRRGRKRPSRRSRASGAARASYEAGYDRDPQLWS